MKKTAALLLGVSALTACDKAQMPSFDAVRASFAAPAAEPAKEMESSSEVVNLSLTADTVADLPRLISTDPPTRAEIRCAQLDALCMQAKSTLDQQHIPLMSSDGPSVISLFYQRVIVRDCNNNYVNMGSAYNLSPQTFGCAVTANTIKLAPTEHAAPVEMVVPAPIPAATIPANPVAIAPQPTPLGGDNPPPPMNPPVPPATPAGAPQMPGAFTLPEPQPEQSEQ